MQNRVATALERGDGRGEFGWGEGRREKGKKRRDLGWIGRAGETKASRPPSLAAETELELLLR